MALIATQGSDVPEFNEIIKNNIEFVASIYSVLGFESVGVDILLENNKPGIINDKEEQINRAITVAKELIK